MSRLGASIAALTLSLLAMSGQAQASIEDKDVAKLTSFGGMCANCDLAGRKRPRRFIRHLSPVGGETGSFSCDSGRPDRRHTARLKA